MSPLVIRSCIALANPPYGRYGRLQLETIPPGAPIRGALTHGDLAMRNSKPLTLHQPFFFLTETVMVGDDLGFPEEHRTATVGLKLIDLGMTRFVSLTPNCQTMQKRKLILTTTNAAGAMIKA